MYSKGIKFWKKMNGYGSSSCKYANSFIQGELGRYCNSLTGSQSLQSSRGNCSKSGNGSRTKSKAY